MLSLKAERNDDKERLQRLRTFIEYLSKKDAVRCRKIAKNIESSHANYAELCIQQFSEMQTLKKAHNTCLDEMKTLKNKLKALEQQYLRIKEAKGLNLVADQAASNTKITVLEMIEKGHYIEAQQKCNFKYPFIQDLIQYTSLKSIASQVANHQKTSETTYRPGKQYTSIRKFLLQYQERVDSHERQIQEYLNKIERGEIGEWRQPDNISRQLFKLLQRIQFRICNLENQNRELRKQITDAFNDFQSDIQEPQLVSSTPNKRYNQCPEKIITKLRSLTLYLQNNSKENINYKSPEQCLKEIESELSNLQQYKTIMSKDPKNKEEMYEINVLMESMSERVRHLESLEENGLENLRTINRSIESLVKGESKTISKKTKDHEQLYTTIEWNIEVLKKQIEDMEDYYKNELRAKDVQRQEQLASIQRQRDLAKNKLDTINLNQSIFQAHEQFGLQYKKSERSESHEILQDRLKDLEIQKEKMQQANLYFQSLISELQQQNKNLKQKIADDELSMKTIKQERDYYTKYIEDNKAVLKNQLKKIKSLEQSSMISKLSSKKSESVESSLIKSTGQKDCQECSSLKAKNKELDVTIDNLQQQIKSITETLEKTTNQKKELGKRMEELTKQNSESTKKLNVYKRQFEDQNQQIDNLNRMVAQLQEMNEELENNRPKSPSSSTISKSSAIRSTICETNLADEIEEYKTKNKELKKRISQLESKNLKEMQYTLNAKKESQATKKKHQDIKKALLNVQMQLDQQKEENEKLRRQFEELKFAFDKKISQKVEPPKRQQRLFQNFMKQPSSQHRCLSHLFNSKDVFQFDEPQRLHLINILQQQCGPIYQTKLLYHFDPLNRVNFHRYIDNKRHIVTIMKTEYNRIVAAYCESYFSINGTEFGNGLLMPLWDHSSVFRIQKDKKANVYDDYYLLYGNSEIRIRSQQNRVFSNFGISNGYFASQKKKVQDLLGENQREMNLITYEIYTVIFQRDRD